MKQLVEQGKSKRMLAVVLVLAALLVNRQVSGQSEQVNGPAGQARSQPAGAARQGLPRNNAYSHYTQGQPHWTDSLAWSRVTDVTTVEGLLTRQEQLAVLDSARFHQTLQLISRQGGGVLYFPAGRYGLNFDVVLAAGVVLRGADLPAGSRAHQADFAPASRLEFPAYQPLLSGKGNPIDKAFKKITAPESGVSRLGLVNLDLNRVRIDLYAQWPDFVHDKVLLLGLRQNNAAAADPQVPTKVQRDEGQGWQRWPQWDKENIVLSTEEAAVLANCRLNDQTTDSYAQPGYMTNEGHRFDTLMFDHEYHRGIALYKKRPGTGKAVIRDNYVQSSPHFEKILVLGEGVSQQDNLLRDSPGAADTLQVTPKDHFATALLIKKGTFEEHFYTQHPDDTIYYSLLKPTHIEPGKEYPLVLFFHGGGESGGDNRLVHFVRIFAEEKARKQFPCFVLVPHLPNGERWITWDLRKDPSRVVNATVKVMEQLTRNYPIDQDRTYITGLSAGGVITAEVVNRFPRMFAASVMISAYWNFTDRQCEQLQNLPMWINAGTADRIVPEAYTKMMVLRLQSNQVPLHYKVHQGVGHFSWIPLYTNQEFLPWLFRQERKSHGVKVGRTRP